MSLGDRVRARRIDLQLSQVDLAKQAGISQQSLSHIESGRTMDPKQDTLAALAPALRWSVDTLINGERVGSLRFLWDAALSRFSSDELYKMLSWSPEQRISWCLSQLEGHRSVEELAEMLEMPAYQIQDLAAGNGHVTGHVVNRLTERLELPTKWILDGDPGPLNEDLLAILKRADCGLYLKFLRRAMESRVAPEILERHLDIALSMRNPSEPKE